MVLHCTMKKYKWQVKVSSSVLPKYRRRPTLEWTFDFPAEADPHLGMKSWVGLFGYQLLVTYLDSLSADSHQSKY